MNNEIILPGLEMLRLARPNVSRSVILFRHVSGGRRWYGESAKGEEANIGEEIIEWQRDGTIRRRDAISRSRQKDMMYLAKGRPFMELLPMASSLLEEGKIQMAETLMMYMNRFYLSDFKKHRDASLINRFLRLYTETNDSWGVKKWKDWLFSRSVIHPDCMSYAILFNYYLRKGAEKDCRALAEQFPLDCITMKEILDTEFIRPEDIVKLCTILNVAVKPDDQDRICVDEIAGDLFENSTVTPRTFEGLPEVNSIRSKSDGISFLKESVKILRENPGTDLYAVQERLERDCYSATSQKLRSELEYYVKATKATKYSTDMKRQLGMWQISFTKYIKKSLLNAANLHEQSQKPIGVGSGLLFSSILSSIEADKISLITLQEMTRAASFDISMGSASVPLVRLAMNIANCLEREVFAQQVSQKSFLQHTKLSPQHLAKIFKNRGLFEITMRRQYAALERNVDALRDGWIPRWTPRLKSEIGVYVISLALECLRFVGPDSKSYPAFTHRVMSTNGQSIGVLEVNTEVFKLMSVESATPFVEPWSMPMLVPPRPWITYNSGGYLTHKTSSVRFKEDPLHMALIHQADKEGKLEKILCGLDVLGRTAWKINDKILSVALNMWNSGVNVATLEAPFEGSLLEYKAKDSFSSHEEYVEYVRRAMERKENISKSHSNMCDTNYKLEIARQFVGLLFYLPHSVDFRGRAYPIPPHLSHVGSDLSRGLMIFAEGRPLGERGIRWLKIQLANMAGYDKASFDERVAYAERHLDEVYDCADAPLTGRQWWKKADEPWQCLATCIELASALRSPDPTQYISHLPCQQDGSCNGLQHYAALGGDVDGAKQVNLSPSDRPQDVYSAVANLVSAQIEKDAASDPDHIAGKLLGKINRKIVKQTVMTNVYGVTMFGARQQIQDRLKEFNVVSSESYKDARAYIAMAVFNSLGRLFDNAQRIQTWLTEASFEIAKSVPPEVSSHFGIGIETDDDGNVLKPPRRTRKWMEREDPADRYPQTSVYWTTPLGFQVLQPYNKMRSVSLRTVLQNINLRISSKFDPVDVQKQSSAFPPNFVHSLDATHMFMTALACYEAKVTFASVHDCFWTHAATVDEMSVILREQFIKLHSQPILERLRDEFVERYRGYIVPEGLNKGRGPSGDIRHIQVSNWRPISIPPIPPKGDFDINLVKNSDYFFS